MAALLICSMLRLSNVLQQCLSHLFRDDGLCAMRVTIRLCMPMCFLLGLFNIVPVLKHDRLCEGVYT